MFEWLQEIASIAVPVFVIAIMMNVGLTQRPSRILGYMGDWPFLLRMLVANFVAAPIAMLVIVRLLDLAPPLEAGLLIYGFSAGAPFLIKLTQLAEHDVALGASTMLMLMLVTVVYLPVALPLSLEGVRVDALAVGRTLMVQMMLPFVGGMLVRAVAKRAAARIQPWVARVADVALYVVIGAILIGFLPDTVDLLQGAAIVAVLLFSGAAFGFGWLAGAGRDMLEDIGALGTVQRNNAAALLVAAENFRDPAVLVVIAVGSTLVFLILLPLGRRLARDNVQPGAERVPVSGDERR